jgi:mRNA-degrading endonuclease RelE of RelBE toxin-antitoxin system
VSWPPRRIVWSREASRALADLAHRNPIQAEAIRAHLRDYASSGPGDVRKLAGRSGEFRLRVGNWRVIFALGRESSTQSLAVFVLEIGNRRDVYRS